MAKAEVAGQGCRFAADPFHEVAIGDEAECPVVDEIRTEARPEVGLGDGHAHPGCEPLPERPGCHLDPEPVVDFGMTGRVAAPLPEVAQIIEGEREPTEVEHGIEQHRAVAVGEHETVAVRPLRISRVDIQIAPPEHHRDVRHAHGHSGMPAVRLLHGIHRQGFDCVDG